MKDTDLVETIRSLLRSHETNDRGSSRTSALDGSSSAADEFGGEWDDGLPVPAHGDGGLRDLLIELNLTTHEYIRLALRHHGGRLRQQEIADLTGWSEPTVSQKLGEMEDDGHITRFRTGREKIVCLPDDSPIEATEQSADDDGSPVDSASTSGTPSSAPVDRDEPPGEHKMRPGKEDATPPEQDTTPRNPDAPSH